ncbi:MAG: adenylyl-sulfate kinase [Proteobacteria bacterium]|nr:adenylyl-sulfate kinase [Pseudomonadota bacterium]MBU1736563.1 adenylyl-sulfate kinase [Pseudomonadota bacterium]
MATSPNVVKHKASVIRSRRETLNGHKSVNLWFTGLSGSGKSTLAHALEERLHMMGCRTYVFDGDNVRHGLCGDLGFSREDRHENLRRIAEMVNLFIDAGVLSLTAFISPLEEDRKMVRKIIGPENMLEIYCNCPVEVCEERDVKGFYKMAREGKIKNYTGVSAPYEIPENPDIELHTDRQTVNECIKIIITHLKDTGIII